jgi:hypothetical protein
MKNNSEIVIAGAVKRKMTRICGGRLKWYWGSTIFWVGVQK